LLSSHQNFPWITVWDDHEVENNSWKDGSSEMNNTEDSFLKDGGVSVDSTKANAVRAHFEWMPIRQVRKKKIHRKSSLWWTPWLIS
jgi:alkaline phosphatase D